ncbi:MAG TPA: polyhydroxyalkanoic acid system family protein [Polyangiaceae bacterium]
MKHEIPHDLGQAKAREITDKALEAYRVRFAEYDPKLNWKTERSAEIGCTIKGMKIGGSIEVSERAITLDIDVPFLLRPFKGMAVDVIEGEIRKWLTQAKSQS